MLLKSFEETDTVSGKRGRDYWLSTKVDFLWIRFIKSVLCTSLPTTSSQSSRSNRSLYVVVGKKKGRPPI